MGRLLFPFRNGFNELVSGISPSSLTIIDLIRQHHRDFFSGRAISFGASEYEIKSTLLALMVKGDVN